MSTRYTSFRKKCLRPPFRTSSFPYPPGNKFHSRWQNADIKGSPDTFSYSLRISDALIALFPFSLLSTIVLYAVYDSLLTIPKKEPNDFERDLSSEKKKSSFLFDDYFLAAWDSFIAACSFHATFYANQNTIYPRVVSLKEGERRRILFSL